MSSTGRWSHKSCTEATPFPTRSLEAPSSAGSTGTATSTPTSKKGPGSSTRTSNCWSWSETTMAKRSGRKLFTPSREEQKTHSKIGTPSSLTNKKNIANLNKKNLSLKIVCSDARNSFQTEVGSLKANLSIMSSLRSKYSRTRKISNTLVLRKKRLRFRITGEIPEVRPHINLLNPNLPCALNSVKSTTSTFWGKWPFHEK